MAILDDMKVALRVKNNQFDTEIQSVINAARMEMIRAGVLPEKAYDENDDLVRSAIRAYVLAVYSTDTKMAEGYWRAFTYQLDCMRKSSGYMKGAGA